MRMISNVILYTVIVTILILVFSNFILLFPWYMTLVYETFNLSVQSANENCISGQMVIDVRNDLNGRPVFKRYSKENIKILMDDIPVYPDSQMPLYKRGKSFQVAIEAIFPFELNFAGTNFKREIPIKFSLPTTGIHYYKELE